jgi:hypothetical protein
LLSGDHGSTNENETALQVGFTGTTWTCLAQAGEDGNWWSGPHSSASPSVIKQHK